MAIYTPADPRSIVLGRLRQLGYPEHLLTAIDWNATDESSWNPGIKGDNDNSIGVMQWNGPRADALRAFAAERGTSWEDPLTQADFLHLENQTSEKAAFERARNAPDAGSAASIWVNEWERPAAEHAASRTAKYTGGNMGIGGGVTASSRGGGTLDRVATQGQPQDFGMFQPTRGDRVRIGLSALSEGLGALGRGHAPTNWNNTDRLIQELQARGGGAGANSTIQQLATTYGRPDLAQSVTDYVNSGGAAGISPEEALKEALKNAPLPGQELSKGQLDLANQFRDEFNVKSAPLAQIELAAGNVIRSAQTGTDSEGARVDDYLLIQQFAKLLDPMSVVREGEVSMVANTAGGIQGWIQSWTSLLDPKTHMLPEGARQQLLERTQQILEASRKQTQGYYSSYAELLRAQGIDPKWLGTMPAQGAPTNAGPGAGTTEPPAPAEEPWVDPVP